MERKKVFKWAAQGLGILAAILVLVTFLARGGGRSETQPPPRPRNEGGFEDATPAAKELRSLALQYHDRIEALEGRSRDASERLAKLESELGRIGKLLEAALQSQAQLTESLQGVLPRGNATTEEKAIARIGSFEIKPQDGPPQLAIPPGSFGEGVLLTGVFAPVTGEAMPVLIKLDSVLVGPSRTRIPVSGAFLVGKATGDANSSRAVIQLHSMSFVDGGGRSIERKVNGWVVDADGIQGLAGKYVWNAKEMALLSAASGTAQGMANALSSSQTTATSTALGSIREVTKSAGDYAAYQGAGSALAGISKIIEERMREFVPSVYVSNANRRVVTVVFLEGVSLEGAELHHTASNPFGGLDAFDR